MLGPCRQIPVGLQLLGQQQWEQGLACSSQPLSPDNSAEGLCPSVGLLWFYVTGRSTTAISTRAPEVSGGVERQELTGEAKPWCCALPQPAR